MDLANCKQPAFNTSMMGVVKCVLDYYGLPRTDAEVYGLSGHAFLINLHPTLCPSGPYCWNRARVFELIENLGVRMIPLGFFHAGSSPEDRAAVERQVIDALDRGEPASLLNLENQLITGYDETGLKTSQPWEYADFPPKHLTFGTWSEFGAEIRVDFYRFQEGPTASAAHAFDAALRYAVDVYHHGEQHAAAGYLAGAGVYDAWARAVEAGHGSSHGHWWNATVWAECRLRAAEFFRDLSADLAPADLAGLISADYAAVSKLLGAASDKEMLVAEKVSLLRQASVHEANAIRGIESLLG
jgi:hypothetical protein